MFCAELRRIKLIDRLLADLYSVKSMRIQRLPVSTCRFLGFGID